MAVQNNDSIIRRSTRKTARPRTMKEELEKRYEPAHFETRLYEKWEREGYFTPVADPERPKFSIVIPPPNVTGRLHIGHALVNTLQDIIVRWKHMSGFNTLSAGASGSVQTALGLWLPFRVECWRDDGPLRSWSWRVAGVPATEHSVISRGPSRCRVEMSVPWWAVPYLSVVRVALTRIRGRAEGVASS
jgi:hypothetical protein